MDKRQATEFLGYLLRDKNIERTIYEDALKIAIESLKAQLSRQGTTKDTISRQAVLDAVEKNACNTQRIIDAVNNLPPVQPEPQEGYWIWVAGELMCSECRTIYSDLYPDYDNAVACPHCGAKMTISTK